MSIYDKYKKELYEREKARLEQQYPNEDAWRVALDQYQRMLDGLSDYEITLLYANEIREEFRSNKKALIESGALREIYQGKRAGVYSLADVGYGIVVYADKPGEGNAYDVLFCVLEEIEAYIKDDSILYEMMTQKVDVTKEAYIFNDKFDKRLEELNQRRIQTGFTRVDREKEDKMLISLGLKKKPKKKFRFWR